MIISLQEYKKKNGIYDPITDLLTVVEKSISADDRRKNQSLRKVYNDIMRDPAWAAFSLRDEYMRAKGGKATLHQISDIRERRLGHD